MFSQDKSKKAVSVIVGYVILISFAVVIGLIVFQWMKTYVPQDELNCPDGVSIFIEDYNCSSNILTLNLKNNGKFSLGGYFIYATDSPEEELATIDLSKNNTDPLSYVKLSPTGIKLGTLVPRNAFLTNHEDIDRYNLTGISKIYSIEIIPIRWQKSKNRNVLVSCKDINVKEIIKCDIGTVQVGETCVPSENPTQYGVCGSAVCGSLPNGTCGDISCGPNCAYGFNCDASGQCVSSSCTPALDPSHTGVCGSAVCGTALNGSCGAIDCGPVCSLDNAFPDCVAGVCVVSSCVDGFCNTNGLPSDGCEAPIGTDLNCASCGDVCTAGEEICVDGSCTSILIGNGICDPGETCEQEPVACKGHQADCGTGYICISEQCQSIQQGGTGCTNYCISLLHTPPYRDSSCTANKGQCGSAGGVDVGGQGDIICTSHNPSYPKCCCFT